MAYIASLQGAIFEKYAKSLFCCFRQILLPLFRNTLSAKNMRLRIAAWAADRRALTGAFKQYPGSTRRTFSPRRVMTRARKARSRSTETRDADSAGRTD